MHLYRVEVKHSTIIENIVVWARSSDESFDQALIVLKLDWDEVSEMKTKEVQ